MDPTNPREDIKAKFRAGQHHHNGAGGEPRLEAVPKNAKNDMICQKRPVLPNSLCDDPQWQQHDFSA